MYVKDDPENPKYVYGITGFVVACQDERKNKDQDRV